MEHDNNIIMNNNDDTDYNTIENTNIISNNNDKHIEIKGTNNRYLMKKIINPKKK